MISGGDVVIIAAGMAALAGMMLTNPDYNQAVLPFETRVASGASGQTRLISGMFESWTVADRLAFTRYGEEISRDSEGVFLIVGSVLSGTTESTMINTSWVGTSGREYSTTSRVADLPGLISDLWLQPGLESRATAIFELPRDEVDGGALRLSLRLDPDLDGVLLLAPPSKPPTREDVARLDR